MVTSDKTQAGQLSDEVLKFTPAGKFKWSLIDAVFTSLCKSQIQLM